MPSVEGMPTMPQEVPELDLAAAVGDAIVDRHNAAAPSRNWVNTRIAIGAASVVAMVAPGVANAADSESQATQGAEPQIVDYNLEAELQLAPGDTVVIDSDLDDNGIVKTVEKNEKFLKYERAHGTPDHWVKKQKKAGHCEMVGEGTDTPVYINSGRDVNGTLFTFQDTDREQACIGKDGEWHLVRCDNQIWGPKEKTKHFIKEKPVTLVKTFAKKINGKVHETATAQAECSTNDAAATAYGYGSAEASFKTRLKDILKAKGVNVAVKASGLLHGKAKADAIAQAQVACADKPGNQGQECKPGEISIKNPIEHVYPNGRAQITVEAKDPDTPSDQLDKDIYANRGTLSDLTPKRDANGYVIPNTYVAWYTADGTSGGSDTITATVSDGVDANCSPDTAIDDGDFINVLRPADEF